MIPEFRYAEELQEMRRHLGLLDSLVDVIAQHIALTMEDDWARSQFMARVAKVIQGE